MSDLLLEPEEAPVTPTVECVAPGIHWIFSLWVRAGGFHSLPCLLDTYKAYYLRGWEIGQSLLADGGSLDNDAAWEQAVITQFQSPSVFESLPEEQRVFLSAIDRQVATCLVRHALLAGQLDAQNQTKAVQ